MTAPAPTVSQISAERFLELASGRGSWRQYPAYATEAARRVGSKVRFVSIGVAELAIAVAAIRYRAMPFGLGATALVSQGPILLRDPGTAPGDLADALAALAGYGAEKGWELRLDPDPLWWLVDASAHLPAMSGPDEGGSGYRTIVMDIAGPAETIRKGLDGKWRRSLQQAEKAGLEVEVSDDPSAIARAQVLLTDLMQRKTFSIPQDAAFFARVAEHTHGDEKLLAHTVTHEGRIASIHIGAFAGEIAVYLLGATTPEGRKLGASYLAQWRVIETAKKMGKVYYDLGGIDSEGNPDVYRFKKRMGGSELELPPVATVSCSGPRARAARMARQLMTRIKG